MNDTFYSSPTIEDATVAMIWRDPNLLEQFLCDPRFSGPQVFLQQHCKEITRAIYLVTKQIGAADFASVAQCMKELGTFTECGGFAGLNDIYRLGEPTPYIAQIFDHYLDILQTYANGRAQDPPMQSWPFTAGAIHRTIDEMKDEYLRQNRLGERQTVDQYIDVVRNR
jgi:hypothetical protein